MEYEINIKRTKYGDIVWTITFNTDIVSMHSNREEGGVVNIVEIANTTRDFLAALEKINQANG